MTAHEAFSTVLSVDLDPSFKNPTKIMLNPRRIGSAAGLGGEKVCPAVSSIDRNQTARQTG